MIVSCLSPASWLSDFFFCELRVKVFVLPVIFERTVFLWLICRSSFHILNGNPLSLQGLWLAFLLSVTSTHEQRSFCVLGSVPILRSFLEGLSFCLSHVDRRSISNSLFGMVPHSIVTGAREWRALSVSLKDLGPHMDYFIWVWSFPLRLGYWRSCGDVLGKGKPFFRGHLCSCV